MRVNMQFLLLEAGHAVIELPKDKLYQLYEQATSDPYSFLFVYYLKPKNEMFYKRFEKRLDKIKSHQQGPFSLDDVRKVAGNEAADLAARNVLAETPPDLQSLT